MAKLYIANEVIKYQDNDMIVQQLNDSVVNIYDEITGYKYKNNKELLTKSQNVTTLVSLLRKRFNLNLVIDEVLSDYMPAAVIPFFANSLKESNINDGFFKELYSGNPFTLSKRLATIQKDHIKKITDLHNKTGYVDNKHARVGGYLSEVKHYLIFNFYQLNIYGLTPKETVAVILHEIGHAFHGLAYHHSLETSNMVISDIVNEINNNNPDKAILKFKRNFTKEEFNKASVNSNSDIIDFYGHVALGYLGEINTQMLNSKYDDTTFENLADMFSARFNLGKELSTALNKIYIHSGMMVPNKGIYYTILTIDILFNIVNLIILTPIGYTVLLLVLGLIKPDQHMTYDKTKDRYNRIRNTIVNHLKDNTLPKEVVKDLLEQIEVIDNVLAITVEYNPIIMDIINAVSLITKNDHKYIEIQQTIENNLNNGLFIKAAQLSIKE